MYDIIVIGGGPAGLTAAIYGLRLGKTVLVIEKENFGGQMTFSPKIENYPGFVSISGSELAQNMVEQAGAQGADFAMEEVTGIELLENGVKKVITDFSSFEGKTVIIAVGVRHRLLKVPGEEDFLGNGISFCAICDGAFYEGKDVAVIGGGNSALQEAVLLSKTSRKVIVVQNLDFLTGEKKLVEILEAAPNVEILLGYVVDRINGGDVLTGLDIKKVATGEVETLKVDGIFTAIGLEPVNGPFTGVAETDKWGYLKAGEDGLTQTEGVFVAGDCRTKKVRQVSAACSDGAWCAIAACDFIDRTAANG
ncbi:MAG: FAD-dependent oxidoreductase [Clostridia bacterium]|nr:FAD-dependent oxidoreductase [Clostridia bacterium]